MSEEERPHQNLTQLDLDLELPSCQNCEKQISLVKPPSHGILLWKPKKTNIELFSPFCFSYFSPEGKNVIGKTQNQAIINKETSNNFNLNSGC